LVVRGRSSRPILVAATAGAIAFWVLTGITRSDALASRYVYVSAVFILLIAGEACGDHVIRGARLAVGGALLAGVVIANFNILRFQERGLRTADDRVRAELRGLEIAAPIVAAPFAPDPAYAPAVTAARYLAAVHDLGSPALSVTQLQHTAESGRLQADSVIVAPEHLGATRATGLPTPCRSGSPSAVAKPGQTLFVAALPGATANLFVRRFADQLQPTAIATAVPGERMALRFASDRAPAVP